MRSAVETQRVTRPGDRAFAPARHEAVRSPSHVEGMAAKILGMQQALGNQAVQRWAVGHLGLPGAHPQSGVRHTAPRRLQAKLAISQPGDSYEQEADRVADEVMRMPEPPISRAREWEQAWQGEGEAATLQRKCAACASGQGLCPKCAEEEVMQRKPLAAQITPLIQRQAMEEPDEEDETLQTKKAPARSRSIKGEESVPPIVHEVLRSPGQPLDQATRAFFEPRFGCDFSQMRLNPNGRGAGVEDGDGRRVSRVRTLQIPVSVRGDAQRRAYLPYLQSDITHLGGGQPLDRCIRHRLEAQTGTLLDSVRVHQNEQARLLADALGVSAFTWGQHIVLGSAVDNVGGQKLDWLIAHEVAHTIQQKPGLKGGPSSNPELEADRFAEQAVRKRDVGSTIDRAPTKEIEAQALRRVPLCLAPALTFDVPGTNLMLILDAETHFIGGCVRAVVPHVGVKLVRKGVPRAAGNLVFDVHIGISTNAAGQRCVFFYESVTRFCETLCDPTRNVREWIREKLRELARNINLPFLVFLIIVGLIVAAILILAPELIIFVPAFA